MLVDLDRCSFQVRYELMATDQVSCNKIAAWLSQPLFAKWVEKKRKEPLTYQMQE